MIAVGRHHRFPGVPNLDAELDLIVKAVMSLTGKSVASLPEAKQTSEMTRFIQKVNDNEYREYIKLDGAFRILGGGGSAYIELRVDSGYIQWRTEENGEWTNLISTESLRGPVGLTGATGATGPAGQSIDHCSFTSTTGTAQGQAGETDTYTVWGDAAETINLGTFTVYNGSDGSTGGFNIIDVTYAYQLAALTPDDCTVARISSTGVYAIYLANSGIWKNLSLLTNLDTSAFGPDDLPNLRLWLQPSGMVLSGTSVSTWGDSSGNGFHFDNDSLGVSNLGTLNSISIAQYTDKNDSLASGPGDGIFWGNGGNFTLVLVFKIDTAGTTGNNVINQYLGSADYGMVLLGQTNSGTEFTAHVRQSQALGLQEIKVTCPIAAVSTHVIYVAKYNNTTKTLDVYVGGTHYTGTNANVNMSVGTSDRKMGLGCFINQSNNVQANLGLDGDIAEVIIYKDAKSSADINQVGAYLSSKYALTWTDI